MADVYERLSVPTVINAVGYATRVAGSCPHPDVVEAMADVVERDLKRREELQDLCERMLAKIGRLEAQI